MTDEFEAAFKEAFGETSVEEKPKGPKALRDLYRKTAKERDEALEALKQYQSKERQSTLADVVKQSGFKPSVAKYIPQDVEDVKEWLSDPENTDGFARLSPEEQAPQAPGARASDVEGFFDFQKAEEGSRPSTAVDPARQSLKDHVARVVGAGGDPADAVAEWWKANPNAKG